MEQSNITIIGAGIIGLATSYLLSETEKDIMVIEKHPFFGQETSSRNSEVIHAGLYYQPDSLKAKMCIKGKKLLYDFCDKNDIPYKKLGKLLIANTEEEIKKIKATHDNAVKSGVSNLEILTKEEVSKLEPDIKAEMAVLSPDTGIIDTHQVMKFFQDKSEANGVDIAYGIEVIAIERISAGYRITVQEPDGESFSFNTKRIINAAGFHSDKIAEMAGIHIEKYSYRIYYNKGQYFRLSNPKKYKINHLIYPPPSATDLGIHITPDLAGGLRLGPDAEYVNEINYDINELDKSKFHESVQKYLPALTEDELIPDTAGIRPKLQQAHESFRDFVIEDETEKGLPGFINLIGIESPGITSCLSIAEEVKKILLKFIET